MTNVRNREGSTPDGRFDEVWRAVAPTVRRFCRQHTRDGADADDLVQRIALRVWRGLASFRGDATPLTWVMRIAEREAARFGAEQIRRRDRESPADHDALVRLDAPVPAGPDDPQQRTAGGVLTTRHREILRTLMADACAVGALTEREAAVIGARFAHPEDTWQAIAERLGTTPTNAAVTHCRGLPRLRAFAFLHRIDLLGGPAAVRVAWLAASSASVDPLSDAEAEVFEQVVLRRVAYRRRGWQGNLRAACTKVAAALSPDLPEA